MAFESLELVDSKPAPLWPSPQFGNIGFTIPHHLAISWLESSLYHSQQKNPTTDVQLWGRKLNWE